MVGVLSSPADAMRRHRGLRVNGCRGKEVSHDSTVKRKAPINCTACQSVPMSRGPQHT